MPLTRPRASQINFDVTNISDPLIRLNSGESGTADKDAGIVIERGSDSNVAILWDESTNTFAVVTTSETGTTAGDVTITSYADFRAKEIHLPDGSNTLNLGDAADLMLYHDGSNSVIDDTGTGELQLRSDLVRLSSPSNSETYLTGTQNGSVDLYYDDVKKFSTISDGVQLHSSEAGSAASPIMEFYRDSASPANSDYLGQLKFKGDNSSGASKNFAKISAKSSDVTADAEDGVIEITVLNNGTQDNVMRINENGLYLNAGHYITLEGTTGNGNEVFLKAGDPSGDRNIVFPDASGTVALTSDITSYNYITASSSDTLTNKTLAATAVSGDITPSSDNAVALGSANYKFSNVYATTFTGTSTSSQYADLAELYEADETYESGTVMVVGGDKEITACTKYADIKLAGVVSTMPGVVMNKDGGGEHPVCIGLKGRVPCKVVGKIKKGDVLTTSEIKGHATKIDKATNVVGCLVGIALADHDSNDPGTIEVFLK
jgi:hypothetical protein